jgi:hypothetical protein
MNRLKKLAGLNEGSISARTQEIMRKAADEILDNYNDLEIQAKQFIGKTPAEIWQSFSGEPLDHITIDTDGMFYDSEDDAPGELEKMGKVNKVDVVVTKVPIRSGSDIEVTLKLYTTTLDVIDINFGDATMRW